MANEVWGQQRLDAKIELSWSSGQKRRYCLPESCAFAELRSMLAFPSPISGSGVHSMSWLFSDSWILEADSPPMKRPKFLSCTFQTTVTRQRAPSSNRSSSSRENPPLVSKFVSETGVVVDDFDQKTGGTRADGFRRDERKSSSDENGTGLEAPERNEAERPKFRVVASSRCKNASLMASDVIGTIDFNENGSFFATGGIARKIRICSYSKMVGESEENHVFSDDDDLSDDDDDIRTISTSRRRDSNVRNHEYATIGEICTPGKLGSLKWRPYGSDVIGCGDYDGVVMEWSIEHGHTVSERYEHSGQRVWSLDYSISTPSLSASASADGTVRVWSRGVDKSVFVIRPDCGNSICSAEFSPVTDHLIAAASADASIYLYDLRNSESPLLVLSGHSRAVSYVRFLGTDELVSASIDSTLKLWDISAPARGVEADDGQLLVKSGLYDRGGSYLKRTFSAHTNVRHFVGLSLHRRARILACGSETDEVIMYRKSSAVPLMKHKFQSESLGYGVSAGSRNSYVGAVCWREQGDEYSLVAANSEGVVQVLQATSDVASL